MDLVNVAQLRARLAQVLDQLQDARPEIYVTQRGEARAVLLSAERYRSLLEQLEYLDDSLEALRARERRESGVEKTLSWDAVKRARSRGRVPR